MDKFADLQSFVKVVEAGTISAAADRMKVAKSAVSRRLTELEQRLGVQLFQRTTRKLNLTDNGRSFYERASRILSDLEEAEQSVSQQHTDLSGTLRIAVPLSFGLLHLTPVIDEFRRAHPKVIFDIDLNDRQLDLIQEGFDLAIRIGRLEDSSMIARRIAPISTVACASPEYLQHHGHPETPLDLKDHACLIYSNLPDPQTWNYIDENNVPASVKVQQIVQANNGDFLHHMAVAGQGILLTPSFISYQSIEKGSLVPILTRYQWPVLNAYAIYPQTRHLSYRVRAFVDFLVEKFEGVPYWEECLQS